MAFPHLSNLSFVTINYFKGLKRNNFPIISQILNNQEICGILWKIWALCLVCSCAFFLWLKNDESISKPSVKYYWRIITFSCSNAQPFKIVIIVWECVYYREFADEKNNYLALWCFQFVESSNSLLLSLFYFSLMQLLLAILRVRIWTIVQMQ